MIDATTSPLPELPREVWLQIFDSVGPEASVPHVSREFNATYKRMVTIWAERIIDTLDDGYKYGPARNFPKGTALTYEQGSAVVKYFADKVEKFRATLSSEEQASFVSETDLGALQHLLPQKQRDLSGSDQIKYLDNVFLQTPAATLTTTPELLKEFLAIECDMELVKMLRGKLPLELQHASREEKFKYLMALTELWLENNQLQTLPELIGNLTALTKLHLYENQLETLPESIGSLKALTNLELPFNRLTSLPESIGMLTALTRLELSCNQLQTLPESIGNLKALTMLHLFGNKLQTLPESIGNLTALTMLDLSSNQLQTLPEWIGNLTALTVLGLGSNQLQTLPESIGNLRALRYLDIKGNSDIVKSPRSLSVLKHLREHGCRIDCDKIVEDALRGLPSEPSEETLVSEPTGEPPAKKEKFSPDCSIM